VQVSRLMRTRYADFSLPRNLRRGKTQALNWMQVNTLLKSVDLPGEVRPDLRGQVAIKQTKKAPIKPTRRGR
ncbi:MAG TPA: hypothetical protein VIM91_10490, partial [Thiomicrospira sp.]